MDVPPSQLVSRRVPGTAPRSVHRINMSWLVRLRWWTITAQAAVIVAVEWIVGVPLPLPALAAILGVEIAWNLGTSAWQARAGDVSERQIAVALTIDVLCFTALLYFTGGPLNPFSFLYLVHIALAALVLTEAWSWALLLLSASLSAALFFAHVPLPMQHDHSMHGHGMHAGHDASLGMHLRGMWIAFGIAAAFIVYFIHRVTRALAGRERELAVARELASRAERVASIATLAAGAAHELSTPLATVAVVAREIERRAGTEELRADAVLIRSEVDRCRGILQQMAGGADAPGEMPDEQRLSTLVESALAGLPGAERVQVEWGQGTESSSVTVPPRAVAQAIRNVVKNGLDASSDPVRLGISAEGDQYRMEVEDRGGGMPPEVLAHAAEPFFTTKEPGQGMGLGLFLARTVIERLGGELRIQSETGRGVRVTLVLPAPAAHRRIAAGPSA